MSNLENLFKQFSGKRVLVAPLDWGLGHVTRCVPIIKSLIACNAEVILAGEGALEIIQKREFPEIKFLPLKGYRIKYTQTPTFFFIKIMMQLPKIWSAVKHERKWLDNIIETQKIDVVISDNRLGMSSNKIPCYFITHQLYIKSPFRFLEKSIQKINYRFINNFKECWVPDFECENNLAGELSHPQILPAIPVKYIGLLSRFHKTATQKKYKIAAVISGPEPQRSLLEKIIIQEFKNVDFPFLLIRGLPHEIELMELKNKNIKVYNHLNGDELSNYMQGSDLVIARSGYSTIMDLVAIQQKAILIPTPGQTEQEYLAHFLSNKRLFKSMLQKDFNRKKVLKYLSD